MNFLYSFNFFLISFCLFSSCFFLNSSTEWVSILSFAIVKIASSLLLFLQDFILNPRD